MWRDRLMLVLMLPGIVYFLLFFYVPLLGNIVAFQDYVPFIGFANSPFVGLQNFTEMFSDPDFWQAVVNTLEISFLQLVFFFPAPILLALLLNTLISTRIRRLVQSVVYLPHFISWVIIVAIFEQILGGAGVIDQMLRDHGMQTLNIIGNPAMFKPLVTSQVIWQGTGWGTVIFLAVLTNVDVDLYEAAAVDGASNWRRMRHITLPSLKSITILLLILQLGNVLNVNFQQILLQRDSVGPQAAEVLNTFVYYHGIVNGDWGLSTAVGLVQGVVGAILVIGANKLAHVFGEPGIYQ
ncbi:MAG TPA: ABC transporter permease subunit [Candidatus Dormibacteraeota bacterium]|nr:ABC transporter permease subunit [Candidatus Dormibacteraeota bacterium]